MRHAAGPKQAELARDFAGFVSASHGGLIERLSLALGVSVEIRTPALTATVQAGLLRRLAHNLTGQVLVDSRPESLPFGELRGHAQSAAPGPDDG